MKIHRREKNAVELIDALQDRIRELESSTDIRASIYDDEDDSYESLYERVAHKSVMDRDGFYTDYTLYRNTETGEYFTIFGDNDLYGPENKWHDADFDSYDEAMEWFDSYNGFEDEE